MSRSRKEFPASVRKARLAHAAGKCEGCGQPLRRGRYQFDHHMPDGLGGQPDFENCRVLCSGSAASCHAIKTEKDKALMQKADNIKNFHQGTGKAKAKIPNPPKTKREPRRVAADLPELPRRSLYR